MRLYGISEDEIREGLTASGVSEREERHWIALRSFPGKFSNCPLKVVYTLEKGDYFVITAYPLRKKYWR